MRRPALLAAVAVVTLFGTGCGGAPILANPPLSFPSPEAAPSPTPRPPDPIPLAFPRDDGPHDRLSEWWYYTGHLETTGGRRFGFQAVVFRISRAALPAGWASHVALTDERDGQFHYAQRLEVGPQVDRSTVLNGAPRGFDLQVTGGGLVPSGPGSPSSGPWRLAGSGGDDAIHVELTPTEAAITGAAFGFDLELDAIRGPVAHDGDGFVDFGPAGSSYYYSRTTMRAAGEVRLDGEALPVEGIAWFDHQWGDFVSVGGGWDWFAISFHDTTALTLSIVRDAAGEPVLLYGTLVPLEGDPIHLDGDDFEVETRGSWTSPRTGRTWPSGWRITVRDYVIDLQPTVDDQELDTRATTSQVYWEGSQVVTATRGGEPVGGEAYVEITRYAE